MRTTAAEQRNRCRISFPAYFAIKSVVFRSGRMVVAG
jgi:hypothetical protein